MQWRTGEPGLHGSEGNAKPRVAGEGMGSRAPTLGCGPHPQRPRCSQLVAAGPKATLPSSLSTGSGTHFFGYPGAEFFPKSFTRVAPTKNR